MKNCVFPKSFQYIATSPSPALACYWSLRKWPANRNGCTTHCVEASAIKEIDWLQFIVTKKTTFFLKKKKGL